MLYYYYYHFYHYYSYDFMITGLRCQPAAGSPSDCGVIFVFIFIVLIIIRYTITLYYYMNAYITILF